MGRQSKRQCSIVEDGERCTKLVHADDWCWMHWERWRKHGNPLVKRKTGPVPTGKALSVAERMARWRKANPDQYRERNRIEADRERKRNPERQRVANARHRARKLEAFVEDVDRNVVFETYEGTCGICGGFIEGDFHVDHIIPLSKGGEHSYRNAQPAHPSCNLSKSDKLAA